MSISTMHCPHLWVTYWGLWTILWVMRLPNRPKCKYSLLSIIYWLTLLILMTTYYRRYYPDYYIWWKQISEKLSNLPKITPLSGGGGQEIKYKLSDFSALIHHTSLPTLYKAHSLAERKHQKATDLLFTEHVLYARNRSLEKKKNLKSLALSWRRLFFFF